MPGTRGSTVQYTVESRRNPAMPGMRVHPSDHDQVSQLLNTDPQAAEVYTLVIDTASNNEEYSVLMTDPVTGEVSYTADASATAAEIADGLAEAWGEDELLRGIVDAVSDGVDTVTFTGVGVAIPFTLAEGENAAKMTLTNTVEAATADSVAFGLAMVATGYDTNDELGVLAKSTALTAKVSTLTVTYAVGEIYSATVTVDEVPYSVQVAADTDDDTTAAALEAALDAILPANTVDASVTDNVVTLTAELAGKTFDVGIGLVSGTASRLVLANTTDGPSTDFNAVFGGVSLHAYDEEADIDTGEAQYSPESGVSVLRRGKIWVTNTETLTYRGRVYVELDGTGDDAGKFFAASSATRVLVSADIARWLRSDHSESTANVAALSLHLPA